MYIAWKEKTNEHTLILKAEVRLSRRNPITGSPVSHFVKYLGSIRKDQLEHIVFNPQFIEKSFQKIENLEIEENEKFRLKEQLRERIPIIKFQLLPIPAFIKRTLRRGQKRFHS